MNSLLTINDLIELVLWIAAGLVVAVVLIRFIAWIIRIANELVRWTTRRVAELGVRFPTLDSSAATERRTFQSFSFGMANFGACFEVAVDDHHLHLTPNALARMLGASAMSIPWNEIKVVGAPLFGSALKAKVGGLTMVGPQWCLKLATSSPTVSNAI